MSAAIASQEVAELGFHPLADLLPMIEGQAFDDLVDSIRRNGVVSPITLLDGLILDGRNRYRAAKLAGVEPWFVEFEPTADAEEFVDVVNYQRRHLTESQKAMYAAKRANLQRGQPKKSAPGQNTLEGLAPSPPGETVETLAEKAGISPRSVHRAKQVLKDGVPELASAVEKGEVPVKAAAEFAKAPKEEQAEAIAKAPDVKTAVKDFRATLPTPKEAKKIAAEAGPGTFVLGKDGKMHSDISAEERARYEKYLTFTTGLRDVRDMKMSAADLVALVTPQAAPSFTALLVETADLLNEVRKLWEARDVQ